MIEARSTLELRVVRQVDDDSWLDEAVALIDGTDQLATLGRGRWQTWIGRSPQHVLGSASELSASNEPHHGFVARCDCGFEDCAGLLARIRCEDDSVIWDQFRCGSAASDREDPIDAEAVSFSAAQYKDALHGVGVRSDWEPTTRRAAVQANGRLSGTDLDQLRIRAQGGFASRGDRELTVVAVLGHAGDEDYAFLRARFALGVAESAEDLAERAAHAVTSGEILQNPDVERRPLARTTDATPRDHPDEIRNHSDN